MRFLLLLLSAVFTLGACRHAKPTAAPAVVAVTQQAPFIRFERTPCMGACPAYEVEISADGTVHYTGHKFAPKEGEADGRLTAEVVANIRTEIQAMNFAGMPEDKYGHGMMDAPSAILTVDGHTVKCTGGECPDELKSLHRYLDREVKKALGLKGGQ